MRTALIAIISCLLSVFSVFAQDKQDDSQQTDKNRKPAVAGQFYPKNPEELERSLEKLFEKAPGKTREKAVQAIITPHAGYSYSGTVAASAFKQVNPEKKYDNIFIIATSHRTRFNGASIYSAGNYETPMGTVQVNRELAKELIHSHKVFQFNEQARSKEHSLEVQLPFIQYYFQSETKIVPIVAGTDDPAICGEMANALRPYFNDNNLFIISTDFSHFPSYEDAKKVDEATADAIVSNSPKQLTKIIDENAGKNIPNLQTSLCGWPGVLTLLYMTSELDDVETEKILYKNSGDQGGTKNRVVGYWSIVFFRNQN
ncbi:MAG: AmmeMemoRadiSam system protein B [Bacteroidales bacterium]